MKSLSLKLEEEIFMETEEVIAHIKKKRNKYINEALKFYNQLQKRNMMRGQLAADSAAVYTSSMEVLKEFEDLEDDEFLLG